MAKRPPTPSRLVAAARSGMLAPASTARPSTGLLLGSTPRPTARTMLSTTPRRAPAAAAPAPASPLARKLAVLNAPEYQPTVPMDAERRERPRSLLHQFKDLALGVPQGLVGLGRESVVTGLGVPRLAVDAITGDFQGTNPVEAIEKYFPAPIHFGQSMWATGGRLRHPTQYARASEQGRLADVIVEDVGNAAIVAGAVGKAIGAGAAVTTLPASEASAVARSFGRGATIRSVGSAVAEGAEPVGRWRAPMAATRGTLDDLSRLSGPEVPVTIDIPGRGLAGALERAGASPRLVEGVAKTGRGVKAVSSLGEKAGNLPAAPYSVAAKGVGKGLDLAGLGHLRPGVFMPRAIERAGREGGLLFPYSETGRKWAREKGNIERLSVRAQRFAIGPARIAAEEGLSRPEQVAALLAVDQPQFLEAARSVTDDAVLQEMLDSPEMFGGTPDVERPSVADVRMAHAYADRALPPEKLASMDKVRDAQREISQARTDREVADRAAAVTPMRPDVSPRPLGAVATPDPMTPDRPVTHEWEQLNNELRPSVIEREQTRMGRARDTIQRDWERESEGATRHRRVANAVAALAEELPEAPSAREGFLAGERSGKFQASQSIGRRVHAATLRELDRAVEHYVALEGGDSEAVQRAGAEVDRLVDRTEQIRQVITDRERRVDAATALTRASGEIAETAGASTRPTPDVGGERSMASIKRKAAELGEAQAEQVFGEIEHMTGQSRLAAKPKGYKGGEYDWLEQADKKVMRRVRSNGFMPRSGGIHPDQLAQLMNAALGTDLSPTQAALRYIETVQRYLETKAGRSPEVMDLVATELGMPVDQVRAAIHGKLTDYRGTLLSPAEQHLDDMRQDYLALDPAMRGVLDSAIDAMLAEPGTTPGDLADVVQDFLPALDMDTALGGMVDMREAVQWMRTGEQPASFAAIRAPRGAAQNAQLGRLEGDVQGARALASENVADRQGARRTLAAAVRDAAGTERAAGRAVDRASLTELANRVPEGPTLPAPPDSSVWRRYSRETDQGVQTSLASPAERLRVLEGRTEERASRAEYRAGNLRKAIDRADDKIATLVDENVQVLDEDGNMVTETRPGELRRTFQERLNTNVNRPMVTRMINAIKKGGEELGGLRSRSVRTGKGIEHRPFLSGKIGQLAEKYGITAELIETLEQMEQDVRKGPRSLSPTGATPIVDLSPRDIGEAFEGVVARHPEITLEGYDATALNDSVHSRQLAQDMAVAMADQGAEGLHANAPYRVAEVVRSYDGWNKPAEVTNAFDAAVGDYEKRRSKHLTTVFDTHAEAMPAKWRTVAQNNRRMVAGLYQQAEKMNARVPGSGDHLIQLAEETATTLDGLVATGIDPMHLTGGREIATAGGGGGGLRGGGTGRRKLRAESTRKSGRRPLLADAYAKVEADQAGRLIMNKRDEYIGQQFGTPARDLPEVRQAMADWADSHSGEVMPNREIAKVVAEAKHSPVEASGQVTPDAIVVPKAIKDQLASLKIDSKWLNALSKGNTAWKSWVLPTSMKWMTGNVIGNVIQAAVHGGVSPAKLVARMNDIRKTEGGWRALWDQSGIPNWTQTEIANHGLTHAEWQAMNGSMERVFRTKVGEKVNKTLGWSYKLNEFVDNMTRSAVDLEHLRRGATSEQAMQTTLRAMGDFTKMTPVERKIIREIFPFYAWMRHQTIATLRLPITSPTRAAMLMNLSQLYRDDDMKGDILKLIGSKIPFGGDRFIDIGSFSPLAEMETPFAPQNIGGSVTPLVKFPLAAITGMDLRDFDQMSRPADSMRRGAFGQEQMTSPLTAALSGNFRRAAGELGYTAGTYAPSPIKSIRDLILGDEARYQSGDVVGDGHLKNPNLSPGRVLLRGLNLPSYNTIDVDETNRRAEENKRRQRG